MHNSSVMYIYIREQRAAMSAAAALVIPTAAAPTPPVARARARPDTWKRGARRAYTPKARAIPTAGRRRRWQRMVRTDKKNNDPRDEYLLHTHTHAHTRHTRARSSGTLLLAGSSSWELKTPTGYFFRRFFGALL